MIRRLVRVLVAVVLTTAMPIAFAGAARADAPDRVGWWWEVVAQPGLGTVVPSPPNVPDGGMYLSVDPSGPQAVGAVHFAVGGGESPTLKLTPGQGSTFSSTTPVSACPATSTWQPAQKGDWDSKPTWNSVSCTPGQPASDGTSMTWELGSAFQGDASSYNIVLVPQGPAPFQVSVNRPEADALTGAGDEETSFDDTSASTSDETASESLAAPDSFSTGDQSFVPPGPSGTFDTPAATSSSSSAAAGGQSRKTTTPPSATFNEAAANPISSHADHRGVRIGALVVLAMLGAALWWLGGAEARPPRLLGSLGGGGDRPTKTASNAPVRGIGRFARPRSTAAQRL